MDDLFPNLQGFTPRASTSKQPAAGFALDPALASTGGTTAPRQALGGRGEDDAYWDDDDDAGDGNLFDSTTGTAPRRRASVASSNDGDDDDDEDDEDATESETDAEDEYAAATQGQGRARGTGGGNGKGKGRAVDHDQTFRLDEQADEDLE